MASVSTWMGEQPVEGHAEKTMLKIQNRNTSEPVPGTGLCTGSRIRKVFVRFVKFLNMQVSNVEGRKIDLQRILKLCFHQAFAGAGG